MGKMFERTCDAPAALAACADAFGRLRAGGLDDVAEVVKLRARHIGNAIASNGENVAPLSSSSTIVDDLRRRVDGCIASRIASGATIALLGFADHWNAGDSAIWCGTRDALDRIRCRIVYQCDSSHYDAVVLRQRIGTDGIICLHEGGNLGDLWPVTHRFRETVIRDFPEHRIIQMPQSLHFSEQASRERFRELIRRHGRFELMVRDHRSLRTAHDDLDTDATLCPDMALAQNALVRPHAPSRSVVWLSRTDHEARFLGAVGDEDLQRGGGRFDWVQAHEVPLPIATQAWRLRRDIDRYHAILTSATGSATDEADAAADLLDQAMRRLAGLRQQRGLELISAAEVLITDRLHGHILALMMGVPSVVMDNTCGKIRSFYETWTHGCWDAFFCNDAPAAVAWARACREGLAEVRLPPRAGAASATVEPPQPMPCRDDAARTTIVTACMNREQNLSKAIQSWIATHPARIVICDWGSSEPLSAAMLGVADAGIKVDFVRCEADAWVLTWAFNEALITVNTEHVLKLDCDHRISPDFFVHNPCLPRHVTRGRVCRGRGGLTGAFLCDMTLLRHAGFFDERLTTWGFDDIDLYRRMGEKGLSSSTLAEGTIEHLPQSDESRTFHQDVGVESVLAAELGWKVTDFLSVRNRHLAGMLSPWGVMLFSRRKEIRHRYHGELGAMEAAQIAAATWSAFHEGLSLAGRTSEVGESLTILRSVLVASEVAAASRLGRMLIRECDRTVVLTGDRSPSGDHRP